MSSINTGAVRSLASKIKSSRFRTEMGIAGVLMLFYVFMCFASPYFFSKQNMLNILSQISIIAVLCIGQTFVMLTGGIDLSVGNVLGLLSMVLALVMRQTESIVLSVVACILMGVIIGALNGALVSYAGIPAFITTLGTMMIARSTDYLISGGHAIANMAVGFDRLTKAHIFSGVRLYYIGIVLLYFVMGWILSNTKLGRFTYAIGSNEDATRLAGINVKLYKLLPYVISSVMASIGAILMSSRLMAVDPNYGTSYEMDTLAAVVIGGCAMTGGKGSLLGTGIGVVFLGLIKNGLDIVGVSPYWQGVSIGSIIICALLINKLSENRSN